MDSSFQLVIALVAAFALILRAIKLFNQKGVDDFVKNQNVKSTQKNGKQIAKIIDSLDILVSKNTIDAEKIKSKLPLSYPQDIENFTIVQNIEVETNTYLFVTLATFEDYSDVATVELHFKLILSESDKNNLAIYSDLHENLILKNVRSDFGRFILNYLNS